MPQFRSLQCDTCGRVMHVSENARSFNSVCRNCRTGGSPRPAAIPQWPQWAKLLKRLRKPNDAGVGDTAQRIAAKFGGERYKAFSERLGMPCGCSGRQAEWNRLYPYV